MSRAFLRICLSMVAAAGWAGAGISGSGRWGRVWAVEGELPSVNLEWPGPLAVAWNEFLVPLSSSPGEPPTLESRQRTRVFAGAGAAPDRFGGVFHAGQFSRASYEVKVGAGRSQGVTQGEWFEGFCNLGLRLGRGAKISGEVDYAEERLELWADRAAQSRVLWGVGLRVRQDSPSVQTDASLRYGRGSLDGSGNERLDHRLLTVSGVSRFLLSQRALIKLGLTLREDNPRATSRAEMRSGIGVATASVHAQLEQWLTAALGTRGDRFREGDLPPVIRGSPIAEATLRPGRRVAFSGHYGRGFDYRAFDQLYLSEEYVEPGEIRGCPWIGGSWEAGVVYFVSDRKSVRCSFGHQDTEGWVLWTDRDGDTLREPSTVPRAREDRLSVRWEGGERQTRGWVRAAFSATRRQPAEAGVPRLEMSGAMGVTPLAATRIELEGTFSGEREFLRSGSQKEYAVLNGSVTQGVGPNVSFSLWGENIGNVSYEKYEGLRAPGRRLGVRLELAF